jgi:multidrug efflux pump subunit AcrA (membrane-fusion protein)
MKKPIGITHLLALWLFALLATACKESATVTPTPASSAPGLAADPGVIETGRLTALGTILPAQRVKLGFSASGPVRVVRVQAGTQVKARDVLAELDTADLEMDIREAEDELALNQALLAQAKAGAREGELAIAQAEYDRTLAQHEDLLAGARPEEIAMAQADYQVGPATRPSCLRRSCLSARCWI